MKINIISILAPLASAAILAGCAKTAPEYSWATDPDAVVVNASVSPLTRSNPLGDEDAQKKFNIGDRIEIWQSSTNERFAYVLGENGWSPADNGKYMVWPKNGDVFDAEYQKSASSKFVSDQHTLDGLASADYMKSGNSSFDKPGDNQLNLQLKRQFSLVTVKIVGYDDQYNKEKDKISDLKIHLTGRFSDPAEAVSPYVLDDQGKEPDSAAEGTIGWTYSAIGTSPKDNADGSVFIEFMIAGRKETVTGIPTLEAGKKYTFKLNVGKRALDSGDITVSGWGSAVDLIDGGGEQDVDA